jgi:hypothetical protein
MRNLPGSMLPILTPPAEPVVAPRVTLRRKKAAAPGSDGFSKRQFRMGAQKLPGMMNENCRSLQKTASRHRPRVDLAARILG